MSEKNEDRRNEEQTAEARSESAGTTDEAHTEAEQNGGASAQANGGGTAANGQADDETAERGQDAEASGDDMDLSMDESDKDTPREKEGKFFKKNKKPDKKDKQQEKIEELEDRVRRQMAEFENFRKRTEKEKTAMFETGARSVIEKILPVVDNFERGLASVPEEEKNSPFSEGMSMVYKQLLGELEKLEVRPIEAVGKEFNPDFHNAVMQVESEEYESGVVAQELQKGYTYRDTVVRHSMVAVVP